MKKLLLASCLVFAGLVPAKADSLPKKFLGEWCQIPDGKYLDVFHRDPDCKDTTDVEGLNPIPRGKITITTNGIAKSHRCIFTKIKRIGKNSVRVQCKGNKGTLELSLSDDLEELPIPHGF
jgi:hypothetical protein